MNDQLFAVELAAVLASNSYSTLRGLFVPAAGGDPQIHAGLAAADVKRPTLTISGLWQPFLHRRNGEVNLEIRSRIGDETNDREHHSRFLALWAALLGAQGATPEATRQNLANAKVALKAALQLRGKIELIQYGPHRNAVTADVDGDDLRTTITLQAVWAFLPL